jgi:hypothetical protein
MGMSDALQILLDSGALYLALGAVICIAPGMGATGRLFQGADKIKSPQRGDKHHALHLPPPPAADMIQTNH